LLHDQLVGFEDNLNAFLSDCRARAHAPTPCTYASSGDPATQLNALMAHLDTHPLAVGSRLLTRALAVIGVLTPLYSADSWPRLDAALTAAQKGDGGPLLQLSDLYLDRSPDGTYSNSEEAGLAINCLDRPVPTSLATYDALAGPFASAAPFFGPAFQYSNLTCAYWSTPPVSFPAPASIASSPPLLLVGGTHDPATPYIWSQAVAASLPSSVLLTRDGYGHTSYGTPGYGGCIERDVDAYLISLTLPAPNTICRPTP
jgi:pimeloyl-ACP methyl ester carboxylesterase